jgi:hypothetical protein
MATGVLGGVPLSAGTWMLLCSLVRWPSTVTASLAHSCAAALTKAQRLEVVGQDAHRARLDAALGRTGLAASARSETSVVR